MSQNTDRQETIRTLLAQEGRVSVDELALRLKVTTMTIRRDLAAMEADGLLTRTHGGCISRATFARERPFAEKTRLHSARKLAIAHEVVRRFTPGLSVYLDTGTTAVEVARALPRDGAPRLFTNNLSVAMELFGRPGVEVVVYGGTLAPRSPDLVGEIALAHIDEFRLDVAVIGADALDAIRGEFYSADTATAMLSRLAQKQAGRTFVVADSSKIGRSSLARAGKLGPGVTLFTDDSISPVDRSAIRKAGAELVSVKCTDSNQTQPGSDRSVRSNSRSTAPEGAKP